MNIQAEKIELIKLIADIESEKLLKKVKALLSAGKKDFIIEYPEDHLLVKSGMEVSEQVLEKVWANETNEEWGQYLKK